MENNVKIKNYKTHAPPRPFLHYQRQLNYTQNYPSNLEQAKLVDRFKDLHWQTDQVLKLPHDRKMQILKHQENSILEDQEKRRRDVATHRLNHLQGIKDNFKESRERFARRTQSERPGALEKQLGDKPLYKIVNDAKPVRYWERSGS